MTTPVYRRIFEIICCPTAMEKSLFHKQRSLDLRMLKLRKEQLRHEVDVVISGPNPGLAKTIYLSANKGKLLLTEAMQAAENNVLDAEWQSLYKNSPPIDYSIPEKVIQRGQNHVGITRKEFQTIRTAGVGASVLIGAYLIHKIR